MNIYIYKYIYMGHLEAVLTSYDTMVNFTVLNPNSITEAVHQDAPKCQYCNLIYLKFQRLMLILLVIRGLELLRIVA